MKIKNCELLVLPFLNGKKFLSCKYKNLLSSGENCGSILLAVEVQVLNEVGEEEIINFVAKGTPPTEMLWCFFNTKVTFKKEIALYDTIVPILNQFRKEKGVCYRMPFFAKFFGGRLSSNSSITDVDQDGVFMLENLTVKGYEVGDRFQGFSKECAELILKDLAVFHATPIAYKLEHPDDFKKYLKPHLSKGFFYVPSQDLWDVLKPAACKNTNCAPLIDKLSTHWENYAKWVQGEFKSNDLFRTITHNDLWVNNIMIKQEDGKPVNNVIVDFQLMEYDSPAHDVIFFIYSSVRLDVLAYHIDDLINLYFDTFIKTLKTLQCDTSKFTRKAFDEEIYFAATKVQLTHLMYMLFPILKRKGEAKDLREVNGEGDIFQNSEIYHENFNKRMHFVLLDFEKRGWL